MSEFNEEAHDLWLEACLAFGHDDTDNHPKKAAFLSWASRQLDHAFSAGEEAGYEKGASDSDAEYNRKLESMVDRRELGKPLRSQLATFPFHQLAPTWRQILELIETGELPWELRR